jgi:leader peptidase (prepilin peptidase) / N-methyltransferase
MEYLPLIALLMILAMAVPLSMIDFREHRLPNRFTYPAIFVSLAMVVAAGIVSSEWTRLLVALMISAATWGIGYLLANFDGIGMGDVKLLTAMNASVAWFSPIAVLVILAIGFSLASLVSLGLIAFKKANLKTPIAMGPFLLFGFALVSVSLFEPLVTEVAGS